jgi:hypothetical protein
MELVGIALIGAGLLIVAIGYLWLLRRGWQVHGLWVLGLLIPPLALAFFVLHFRKALGPMLVMAVGAIVFFSPFVISHLVKPDLGPYLATDNEGHQIISLNGWDRTDYAILQQYAAAHKLQMSNPDVSDQTLEFIKDMKELRELELDHTKVTDAGLIIISQLPKLEVLKMRNTKITDKGFEDHIAKIESLRWVDVRGTAVSSKTQSAWKKAGKGRKFWKDD